MEKRNSNDYLLARTIEKLEALYPEHKVFALDNLDKKLRENINILAERIGYSSAKEFLHDQGYEIIYGDEVKKIRNVVIYSPGNEPDFIKPKVIGMLSRLEDYYPSHVIERGLQTDHKSLSGTISGLYQWLGYENARAMLAAYGFEYRVGGPDGKSAGRPGRDYKQIIDRLIEKYKDGSKPHTVFQLFSENPEYSGELKTLQNRAVSMFGMPLKQYFKEIGLLDDVTWRQTKQYEREHEKTERAKKHEEDLRRKETERAKKREEDLRRKEEEKAIKRENERKALKEVTAELKRRYPKMASAVSYSVLKSDNPDLNLKSLETVIKQETGLSPTNYYKREKIIIEIAVSQINFEWRLAAQLEHLGLWYIGEVLKLNNNDVDNLEISNVYKPTVKLFIMRCRAIYNLKIEDLGLSAGGMSQPRHFRVNAIDAIELERYDDNIKNRISEKVTEYYKNLYGNASIYDAGISKRIASILNNNNIFYIYELVNGCENIQGIGKKSIQEIEECIIEYTELSYAEKFGHEFTEGQEIGIVNEIANLEKESGIASDSNVEKENLQTELSVVDEKSYLEEQKNQAKEKLEAFVSELIKRYPDEKECLMLSLRRSNPDLQFDEASEWCRTAYDKPLKEFLQETGLLVCEENDAFKTDKIKKSRTIELITKDAGKEDVTSSNTSAMADIDFTDEQIKAYVKKDTQGFISYIEKNKLHYSVWEAFGYIRNLKTAELSDSMKKKNGTSYAEYLIIHGLIPEKPAEYWRDELLSYLKTNYLECLGGMLVSSEASYEYDNARMLLKISAPLYDEYDRVTDVQLADKYVGKLQLIPQYCEEKYSFDVALTSNGNYIGKLDRTSFRNRGLGLCLSSVLFSGAEIVKNIHLSEDEFINVIFELQFK